MANKYFLKINLAKHLRSIEHLSMFVSLSETKQKTLMKTTDYILLKWGTIKGYKLNDSDETFELMKKYNSLGVSFSAMAQKDTPEQKDLICQMIDSFEGTITNDWTGENYTSKDEAKKYILEYNRN